MTREDFKALVQEAIDWIPERFATAMKNIAIVIEDRPSPALLQELEMQADEVLMGLYQGTPLTERQWSHGNSLPDRITLFHKSIEEECDGDEDWMFSEIVFTLIHEVGHYFGMSEEEIEEIEERYWRGQGA
jgi:predicted Zn-dependent protease with MMP-like domain